MTQTNSRKEYQKKYIREHPAFREHLKEYRRKYYKEHPRKRRHHVLTLAEKEAKKLYHKTPSGRFESQRNRAVRRGIPFTITSEDFCHWIETTPEICYYCHVKLTIPSSRKESGLPTARTTERKDNTKGYSLDNIALCCHRCNSFKGSSLTEDQMLRIGAILSE